MGAAGHAEGVGRAGAAARDTLLAAAAAAHLGPAAPRTGLPLDPAVAGDR